MAQDENKIYQIIYTGEEEPDKNTKPPIEWTVEELKNAVVNSESINNYYCTDKHKSAWLFADTEKSELDNELWRKCETYTYYGYEIYASNRGRIKVNGKICELYEEISKNPKNEEYKKRLTKSLFNILIKNKETHIGYLIAKIPDAIKKNVRHEYFGPYVYQMVADAWLEDYIYDETEGHIHHITNDGYDNRPENLILVSATEHEKIHSGNYGKEDNEYEPGKYDKK